MRLIRIVIMLVAALLPVACTRAQPPQTGPSAQPQSDSVSEIASQSVLAQGVVLSVKVARRDAVDGARFRVTTAVRGEPSTPVRLATPDGLDAIVLVRAIESTAAVFSSQIANQEALESNPGFSPPQSEDLSDGNGSVSGSTKVYQFTIAKPGRYVLSARTFGPVVTIPLIPFSVP